MQSAVLRGREHTRYGGVAVVGEGATAIALSIGGAPKIYSHKDPNEDVAAFAQDAGGVLIAVSDGHGGCDAAEQVIDQLLQEHAAAWTGLDAEGLRERWSEVASDVLLALHHRIVAEATRGGNTSARTTLALALARPAESWLGWASLGDSHIFHVGRSGEVVDFAGDAPRGNWFLGHPASPAEDLRARCLAGVEDLGDTRAVVLVTDGISERGIGVDVPEHAVAECSERARTRGALADLVPLDTARSVVQLSLAAHRRNKSGDNVASAVVWIEDPAATPG
jgi:serine/threonine protein phosphatase PrpC